MASPGAAPAPPTRAFRASGKLMITGEYLVLDGARALACPTRLGQRLTAHATTETDILHWRGYDSAGELWVNEAFTRRGLDRGVDLRDESVRGRLTRLLDHVVSHHPTLWPRGTGLQLTSTLEFGRDWGLGSSATLSYLLAALGAVDPYRLNEGEFGGSGYDVACAGAPGPLLYRLGEDLAPQVTYVAWAPAALDRAVLVHLGRKQDSRAGIARYRERGAGDLRGYVEQLDAITAEVLAAADAPALAEALRRHEALVGYATHQTPIGRERFADFPGAVKSLGAWGGDFALAVPTAEVDCAAYFSARGLATVIAAPDLLALADALPGVIPLAAGDWPVFLYGALGEPRVDNEWLHGYPHAPADLLGYRVDPGARSGPRRAAGGVTPGTLAYIGADDLLALDVHPEGAGYVRTQVEVLVGERMAPAFAWLPVG